MWEAVKRASLRTSRLYHIPILLFSVLFYFYFFSLFFFFYLYSYHRHKKIMGGQFSSLHHETSFQRPVYKDLLSFALDERPVEYDDHRPLYVDAENPAWSLNIRQVRLVVRTLIAGLKRAAGVQQGDCVLLTLPNNVRLFRSFHCSTPFFSFC